MLCFCCAAKCISHMYKYTPSSWDLLPYKVVAEHRLERALYPRFSLVTCFMHIRCARQPPSPSPSHSPLPAWYLYACCLHLCLFLVCKQVHLFHFSICHVYMLIYNTCFSVSDLLHFVWTVSRFIHISGMTRFCSFYGWVIFHCKHVPHLLYPSTCWWTFRLHPWPDYCK